MTTLPYRLGNQRPLVTRPLQGCRHTRQITEHKYSPFLHPILAHGTSKRKAHCPKIPAFPRGSSNPDALECLAIVHSKIALIECTITIPLTITYGSNLEQVESVTLETARHILANSQYGVTGFEPAVRYKELGEYGIAFDVVLRIKNVVDEGILKHQFIKAIYQAYQEAEINLLERTP